MRFTNKIMRKPLVYICLDGRDDGDTLWIGLAVMVAYVSRMEVPSVKNHKAAIMRNNNYFLHITVTFGNSVKDQLAGC